MTEKVLRGLGVGLNAVQGEVLVLAPPPELPGPAKHNGDQGVETEKLNDAIAAVALEMRELGLKAGETSAEIFEALVMILEDEDLLETAIEEISQGWNAPTAFIRAVETFAELLKGDPTFEERLSDIRDMARRVAAKIAGIHLDLNIPQSGNYILVGMDFSPADTAQFTSAVIGVVTIGGGPTSHTAIICRARGIPAVVSCEAAASLVGGEQVLVDPVGDRVVVDGELSDATKSLSFVSKLHEPIISVRANIGSLQDAVTAAASAASGVGLFRTELLYLSSKQKPTLTEQVSKYSEILQAAPEGPIVVRTIDAGSDKPVPFLEMPHEENPALGVRGFRLVKEHREFIVEQLKALEQARVQTAREVWVMAPMISNYQEAMQFAELARENGDFKVGIMIETPAVIYDIANLAGKLDFVSVGTNDLSQYLFAADRMNAQLGALMNHWQPGLLRALAEIAKNSELAGLHSGVCGESASDPTFSIVLAGLGFKSVSASPSQVGQVRTALSSIDQAQAEEVAQAALRGLTPEAAKNEALIKLADIAN